MNRKIVLTAAAFMLLLAVCFTATVAETKTGNTHRVKWTQTDDGVLTFSGEGGIYIDLLPSLLWDVETVRRVVIEEGVTSIGDGGVFQNAVLLTEVVLPEGLQYIGSYAFNGCTSLQGIALPEELEEIGSYAFKSCTSLQEITLPEGLERIGDNAFENCTALKKVKIPAGTSKLGKYIFRGTTCVVDVASGSAGQEYVSYYGLPCLIDGKEAEKEAEYDENGLLISVDRFGYKSVRGYRGTAANITIPPDISYVRNLGENSTVKTVTIGPMKTDLYVDGQGLGGLSAFEAFVLADGAPEFFRVEDGVLYKHYDSGWGVACYPTVKKGPYTVPDWVDWIVYYAFSSAKAVGEITVPESMDKISLYAFAYCPSQIVVHIPESVADISENAFEGTDCVLDVREDSVAYDFAVDHQISYMIDGKEPEEPVIQEKNGFAYRILKDGSAKIMECSLKGKIVIPDEIDGHPVSCLAEKLFFGTSGITSVYIPAAVRYFGDDEEDNDWDYVFSYCYDLQEIRVAEDNPAFCDEDGILYTKNKLHLINYPLSRKGSSFRVPEETKMLCCTSFASVRNLRQLILGRDVYWNGFTFLNTGNLTVYYQPGGRTEEYVEKHVGWGKVKDKDPDYCTFEVYNPGEEPEETGTPGDLNGDGEVNTSDLILLLRYVNGQPVDLAGYPDVSGDGEVNTSDLILLLRYVNGQPVELHA